MYVASAALSLFVVYNVIGNLPIYLSLLKNYDPSRQRFILVREMLIGLFILLLFGACGDLVLRGIGIQESTLGISGGLLILLLSISIIFPKHNQPDVLKEDPLIVPIATPIMAGPGSITTVMVYAHRIEHLPTLLLIILLAWIPSLIIVLLSHKVKSILGARGLLAVERFGGLLLCLIAIQMMTNGITTAIKRDFF